MTKQPVLFLGHGSPMNAIQKNSYTDALNKLGHRLMPHRPKSILCISAHWMTNGTYVTSMARPRTIHDFYGFPEELFSIQYPVPGDPELANQITNLIKETKITEDFSDWGIDHGTWAVLRHVFPKADIPVVQLSLDMSQGWEFHYKFGQNLRALREQDVLIIGSGNIVHNLASISWKTTAAALPWAVEFDNWIKEKLIKRNFTEILNSALKTESGRLSLPTTEHFLPLLYVLGASQPAEDVEFLFEEIQNASISMRCLGYGLN